MFYNKKNKITLSNKNEIKKFYPNISFPKDLTDEILLQFGFEAVIKEELIKTKFEKIIGQRIEIINDAPVLVYEFEAFSADEIKMFLEEEIQTHINEVVKKHGYDEENSIAKYLIDGNPFFEECKKISLWIGAVWVAAIQIMNDVESGNRDLPIDIITELPELV